MVRGKTDGDHRSPTVEFFGRAAERKALARVITAPPVGVRVAVVSAPAGTGKTSLVRAVLDSLDSSYEPVWTRADPFDQDQAFGAVAELVVRTRRVRHAGSGQDSLVGGPQMVERVVEQVAKYASDRSVVVVAEDFQWADPASWRVLRSLANDVAQVAVVVTIRTPFVGDGHHVLTRLAEQGATHIELSDLGPDEARAFAVSMLGRSLTATEVRAVERCGGNPLFMTELLKSASSATASSVPNTLRSLVLDRITNISARDRQVLSLASLLGHRFSAEELAAVADRPVLEVVEGLDVAVRAGVVVADDGDLRFRHGLVADCIKDDQPVAVRRVLHRHIAVSLAKLGSSTQRVAEHYVLASVDDNARALPDAEAAVWLSRASNEAELTSLPTAVNLMERAVAATADVADRLSRRIQLARLLLMSGRLSDAEAECRSILESEPNPLHEALSPLHELAARGLLGAVLALGGPLQAVDALAEMDAFLDLCGPDGPAGYDRSAIADALSAKAMVVLYAARPDESVALAEQAIEEATASNNPTARSRAHEALALAAMTRMDAAGARLHARESLRWFSPTGGPWAMVVTPHLTASMVLGAVGDMHEAQEVCEAGLEVCAASGHLMPRIYLLPCLAVLRLINGDLTEAENLSALTNSLIDDWCPTHASPVTRAIVGYVAWLRGDVGAAVAAVDRAALEMWSSGAQVAIADMVAWLIASVYEGVGRGDDAFQFLELVWTLVGAATGAIVMAADLVRLAVPRNTALANDVVDELRRRFGVSPNGRNNSILLRSQAVLTGDPELAMQALAQFDASELTMSAAWTARDAAELLTATGERSRAEPVIRDAIRRFDQIGAPTASASLRAMGRLVGLSLRPSRSASNGSLTEVEQLVASLAIDGLTSREIGERLFISARTVEAHLSRVFAKLGIKNRVQLASRPLGLTDRSSTT
jgi:DNA-binding CsgD family transcriptional regulator